MVQRDKLDSAKENASPNNEKALRFNAASDS